MFQSENINELATALSKAQGIMHNAKKAYDYVDFYPTNKEAIKCE